MTELVLQVTAEKFFSARPPLLDSLQLEPLGSAHRAALSQLAADLEARAALFAQQGPADALATAAIDEAAADRTAGLAHVFAVIVDGVGFVGMCRLDRRRVDATTAALGYYVSAAFRGRGYATTSAARILEFAFSQAALRRITARCVRDNVASLRLLHKLGFVSRR